MIGGSFSVGQRLTLNHQVHRVLRDLGKGVISLEELATGRIVEHALPDLLVAWKAGNLILGDGSVTPDSALNQAIASAHLDAFRQTYSEAEQDQAKARLAFVERLEKLPRTVSVMGPLIEEIWADKKLWKGGNPLKACPHFTTVLAWITAYQDSGRDIRVLVDSNQRKGNTSGRHHEIVQTIVRDLIETRYLTLERPPLKAVRKEAVGLINQRNATRLKSEQLTIPGYGYFRTLVKAMAPYDVHRARYGQRAADIKFRAAGRGVPALQPLARAAMDHSRMDVFVVDERTGLPLGRPWLTLIIDEHSRYVLGYYLGFEEPSNVSMTRALRHALAPKDPHPDLTNPWDAWGVIDRRVVDNGLEFHARALEAGAGRYGIDIQFCPRRKPWYKGKIERFFGTLNTGLLADMKGKTFSSVVLKGDYDPIKHAVMSLATLRRVVQMWIVDVYHQEVHSGLGMTPQEAWNDGIQRVDRYLPPSSVAVDAAFSAACQRELSHKGIEFDSLFYNSPDLGALRELHGNKIKVEVRTCDDDLGHVVVVSPDQQTLIKVPALEVEYAAGLTRWQHKVCKRYQRRVQEDEAREISLQAARQKIRSLIEEDMRLGSRKSRKSQQRFMEDDTSSAVDNPVERPVPAVAAEPAAAAVAEPSPTAPSGPTPASAKPTPNAPGAPASASRKRPAQAPEEDEDADDVPTFTSRKLKPRAAA